MKTQSTLVLSLALVCLALGACAASGPHRSTGQVIDDTTIATRTKTALLADSTTDGLNIDVEVDRDKVQLNGFVDSQAQVDRAGEIARSIPGVASVKNNLKVSGGNRMTGEYIDDKALSVSVKAALADDRLAPASEIDVEVNRGVVSLGGYVDSNAERDAAVAAVKGVKGVTKVINNLAVR
ncbi:MAG: BON domain-containing protein [Xanthomonadales bacterium]|nr:BON domain-containing protein [Xanthomonadales bacterium]